MRPNLKTSVLVISCFLVMACNNTQSTGKPAETSSTDSTAFTGDFVNQGYSKKDSGADWVSVSITKISDSSWHASVRARADIKKTTCRFDADLTQQDNHTLTAIVDHKKILFRFANDSLSVSAEKEEDAALLNYYCSGGASLAGTYQKIKEPLDRKQIDNRIFEKMLSLQNIAFDIWSVQNGNDQTLTIKPVGLKIDNQPISLTIKDPVKDAEIEDLNADGYPEVLIYTHSTGVEQTAHVIGFSVNNGKSVSQISFPEKETAGNTYKGYRGGDEFSIVENRLVQRFRVYNPGDANNHPTGNYKQISYKLVNGEASRKFVIDKITEFPAN